MTYRELRNQTGEPGPHPFLYCRECGEHFSANAGDYFWADGRAMIEHCGEPMILARESRRVFEVRP